MAIGAGSVSVSPPRLAQRSIATSTGGRQANWPDARWVKETRRHSEELVAAAGLEPVCDPATAAPKADAAGAYTLQAAIAAVHAESSSAASTDWRQITLLYDRLLRIQPSPVVELNRAVAIAMCEGPEQGLCLIDDLLAREHLFHYHLAHSARADLCRRLGRISDSRASNEKALALARQEPDRRFLARRLEELN